MPEELVAPVGAELSTETHRRLGGKLEPTSFGSLTPVDYGSPEVELEHVRGSVAVADRSWLEAVELRGEDRVRFLNGLITCDVKAPAPGEGVYGYFTDAKGKVLADAAVLVHENRLHLELAPGKAALIEGHLRKYIIADRVEAEALPAGECVALVGPEAADRLARLTGASPPVEPWQHGRFEIDGEGVHVVRHPRLGVEGYLLRPLAEPGRLFRVLTEGTGVAPAGHSAMEIVRVEAGMPVFGLDLDADVLPQETGFEEAVSYTKGCYLGQEIVARIHYRGGVNRVLRGLRLSEVVATGERAQVTFDGRSVGELTSCVKSPALGWIGLGLIHRRAAAAGTEVEVAGAGSASVIELPFDSTRD